MSAVAVAGVVNVRMASGWESFPIPSTPSRFAPGGISVRLSGTGWTVARTLLLLGSAVTFATYVGTDALGRWVAEQVAEGGLAGPTTLRCAVQPRALVLYDRAGNRANTTDLRSTPDLRYPAELFAAALDACRPGAVVLTNIGFTRPLVPVAAARRLPIVTDVHRVDSVDSEHDRDWLAAAHVLACSHERLPVSPAEWVRLLWRRFGTELALVGCGPGGAVVGERRTGRVWHVPARLPRGFRYPSGAGDTLVGSFVHHWLASGEPPTAARYAVLAAGWKVGGTPDDDVGPRRETVDELVRRGELPPVTRLR